MALIPLPYIIKFKWMLDSFYQTQLNNKYMYEPLLLTAEEGSIECHEQLLFEIPTF